jgi:hypothetical protein
MPMPVSATEMVTQSQLPSCRCRASMVMVPWSVNLLALLHEVQQRLPKAHLIRMQSSDRRVATPGEQEQAIYTKSRLPCLEAVVLP